MVSGNDFVIQLKRNCNRLYDNVQLFTTTHTPVDRYSTLDQQKGRIESRKYSVFPLPTYILPKGWQYITSCIKVERAGIRSKEPYHEISYYLSNKNLSAKKISEGIRGHWQIENNLHFVKDVMQNEDKNRVRNKGLAANISMMTSIVLNLFRINNEKSIKFANERFANHVARSFQLISSNFKYVKFRTD